jgi:hypothetical protein
MKQQLRIVAIPTSVAQQVRETMRAPGYGHPAYTEVATGHGPCRHCLQTFRIGQERRILFTYDPFAGLQLPPLPGPVFIHEEPCARHPEDGGFPEELRSHELTLDAYGAARRLLEEEHVGEGNVEAALERMFARSDVDYVHVRDTEAGCYDFRIERTSR